MARLQVPLEVIAEIIDIIAANYPRSLPSCALVSRGWTLRSAHHLHLENVFRVCVAIARLPIELLYRIIDLVAEHDPNSLPTCALVSRQWNLRSTFHLQRLKKTYRHVKIATISDLHEIFDIAKGNAGVGQWPTSLEVSPDPAASTSYIPFLHLSSRTLPNVTRLVWREGLRWTHYPPLYNNGAVGSSFHAVVALDLHCRFKSARDLFRAVRSFKNLEEVRLLHRDPFPPPIAPTQAVPHPDVHTPSEVELQKPLRSLEIPFSALRNVLEVSGDYIANLSIRCPPASALSTQVSGERPIYPSSLLALEAIKFTVPTEPFNPANTGLQTLRRLVVTPISNVDVKYSVFLMRCTEHGAIGYRVEDLSRTRILQALQTPAKMNPLKPCHACDERSGARESAPRPPLPTPVTLVVSPSTPERAQHPELVPVAPFADESAPRLPYGFHLTPPVLPPVTLDSQSPEATLVKLNVVGVPVPDRVQGSRHIQVSLPAESAQRTPINARRLWQPAPLRPGNVLTSRDADWQKANGPRRAYKPPQVSARWTKLPRASDTKGSKERSRGSRVVKFGPKDTRPGSESLSHSAAR